VLDEDQVASLLAKTAVFSDLPEQVRRRLASQGAQRTYRRGQFLFYQGDPGDRLFVILHGLVKIMVASEHGGEMVLVTVGPPETLGELAMLDGSPRSASVQALEPTTVLMLPRAAILPLLSEYPQLVAALLSVLGQLVRRLTEQAADLVFLDLNGRVAKLLVRMATDRGTREGDAVVLDLHLTQSDLARMVGGSRPAVNRVLQAFATRGYLELQGQRIILRELEALRRRANR
jgi:CRP/FNR family transcriptional regulator, cyclic AMP receptor protein